MRNCCKVKEVFNKEYAGEAPYLLLILFFAVFYGLLTVLRFIPKLRDMKTDCAALLISTAQFTVAYAVVMFREKGTNIDFFLALRFRNVRICKEIELWIV